MSGFSAFLHIVLIPPLVIHLAKLNWEMLLNWFCQLKLLLERIRNFMLMTNNYNSAPKGSNQGGHLVPKTPIGQKIGVIDF